MLEKMLENVRKKTPLIHNITNYVTVNDCANILLACGGAPIMSDEPDEAEDITSICGGLCINIGTLNKNTIESMFVSGKRSNELSHPVVLDPVGAGASMLRTRTAQELLESIKITVIRGNISEIMALALGTGTTKGVDANITDEIDESSIDTAIRFIRDFSSKTGAIIAVTGPIDIIADTEKAYVIRNGHPMMADITGSGCMLSAMVTAYVVANPQKALEATVAAVCAMGLCGETAYNNLRADEGNSSYRNRLIDAVFRLDAEKLENGAKYEIK